jgi:hypothetical protein
MTYLSRSLLTGWTGGAMLLFAAVALSPSTAAAGCGNYVSILDGKIDPMSGHHGPEAPCHGPGCSNHPPAPLAPVPPPPTSPSPDPKGLITETGNDSGTDSTTRANFESDGAPVHHPRSIFHPPRLV